MAARDEILKEIIAKSILLRVGQHAIFIIKQRVADGIFLAGSSPDADQYSTKPFAMPIGAIKKKSVMMDIIKGKHPDETQLFQTEKGKLWVVIKRGYKWLREISGKPSKKVDMRWTSQMMKSLKVLKTNVKNAEVEIGHEGARNQQLAQWHNIEGAGKSRKSRKWLSLTEEELQTIASKL